jgi:16S rRNA processing protein RimM
VAEATGMAPPLRVSRWNEGDDKRENEVQSNTPDSPSYLAIGHIVGVHGIRGELKVMSMTDYPARYTAGSRVMVGTPGLARPAVIAAARPHRGMYLVLLDSVSDRTAAEAFVGQYLLIPESEAFPLGEHENYLHDLIGLTVVTVEGEVLGVLREILFTGANDVYVVKGDSGEVLIPATRQVVVKVDLADSTMKVQLPDGLRD